VIDVWQPQTYCRFTRERERAALDLLHRIENIDPGSIVDLGCGTGNLTRRLAERWPRARVVGVDASAAMLTEARATPSSVEWLDASIDAWTPDAPVELLFSNAALHWLDDHATLFSRLVGWLRHGGVMAVQMPRNFDEPSHTAMIETIEAGPWHDRLTPLVRRRPVGRPDWYADLLLPLVHELDIWETVYWQVFEGENPVVAWTSGAALRPLLAVLDEAEQERFLADYGARIAAAYPIRSSGATLFPFRRLFILARR
jgi:Trans-aconitate methyltransferase